MNTSDRLTETQKIVLRDAQGRVRAELTAERGGPELRFFDIEGNQRLTVGIHDEGRGGKMVDKATVTFHRADKTEAMELQESYGEGWILLFDRDKSRRAELTMVPGDLPQLRLNGKNGRQKMMLIVHDENPHLAMYDQQGDPRIHIAVDKHDRPRIRRYLWRWLIPRWEWFGYYPRGGTQE